LSEDEEVEDDEDEDEDEDDEDEEEDDEEDGGARAGEDAAGAGAGAAGSVLAGARGAVAVAVAARSSASATASARPSTALLRSSPSALAMAHRPPQRGAGQAAGQEASQMRTAHSWHTLCAHGSMRACAPAPARAESGRAHAGAAQHTSARSVALGSETAPASASDDMARHGAEGRRRRGRGGGGVHGHAKKRGRSPFSLARVENEPQVQ
jgi:hypothetical protein